MNKRDQYKIDRKSDLLKPKARLLDRIKEAENSFLKNAQELGDKVIFEVPLDMIQVRANVRKEFDEKNIRELADNIKAQMQNHERESYWQEKAKGEVLFSVHYAPESERKELTKRIEEKFKLSRT